MTIDRAGLKDLSHRAQKSPADVDKFWAQIAADVQAITESLFAHALPATLVEGAQPLFVVGGNHYHQCMSDELAAVALRCGRLRLVLGGEAGVTAMEIVTTADRTSVSLDDLAGTAHQLDARGSHSVCPELLFIIDTSAESPGTFEGEIAVDTYGADDASMTLRIRELNPDVQRGILTEAAFAAWRQRLSDAADSLSPPTRAEAMIIGRLDVSGEPLVTELHAERRRALHSTTTPLGPLGGVEAVIENLIVDLRAGVRFGAAGIAEATDDLVGEAVQSACVDGGWVDRLRLLIAAEEIWAIELVASVGQRLSSNTDDDSGSETFDHFLAKYASQRQQAEELALLLDDVVKHLPAAPESPAVRLIKRKTLGNVLVLRETAAVYSAVVRNASSHNSDATTWDEAAKTISDMDRVIVATSAESDGKHLFDRQSVEDAAVLLGELFAQQLPTARAFVDDLARQHPEAGIEGRVQIVKRQTVRELGSESRQEEQPVQETVAVLAMAIALLRGIEPHTEEEFQEMGRQILAKADQIARLHLRVGAVVSVALKGFEQFVRQAQPLAAEFVFQKMSGMKPGQAGAARDAYKRLRSKIWRARYDRGVADVVAGAASKALLKAIDAGGPRLIVRYVDRCLPAPE